MFRNEPLDQGEVEKLFREYVVEKFECWPKDHPPPESDREALALFSALDQALVSCQDEPLERNRWVIDGRLVGLLAAYGRCSLTGSLKGNDTIVKELYSYFIFTLVTAVRGDTLRQLDGKPHFRCFPLPDWFTDWANTWCDYEAFRQPKAGFWPEDEESIEMVEEWCGFNPYHLLIPIEELVIPSRELHPSSPDIPENAVESLPLHNLNPLINSGITHVYQLVTNSERNLLDIKGFGKLGLQRVKKALEPLGCSLETKLHPRILAWAASRLTPERV